MISIADKAFIHAQANASPAWADPTTTTIKRVGSLDSTQHQPNLLSNLDCTSLTYRMVGSNTMQAGCFTPTAFGMLDSDSETVIFNGTDEALPLKAHSPGQVLVPWPNAANLLTLDAANTGGSYLGMYKNPLGSLQGQRNAFGQLAAKQLTAPPEVSLKDHSGQKLVINPQTMAFSAGGSWLVAETLGGSFLRINLASLDMVAFAQAFGAPGSPGALLKSQVDISDDGRYIAIANTVASSFKVYDLATCNGNLSSWQTSGCQSHEYWPFASQQIDGLQSIRHIRFINDGLLSFEATSSNAANSGIYELAPASNITSLTGYIGLGDSYTSGEGAFDYLAGTDTAENTCHLSANSYPVLLARDLFGSAGGHSVACSGAVIDDVASTKYSYRGQVKDGAPLSGMSSEELGSIEAGFKPGYIAQHMFVQKYQPDIITVSIGGNDIGFGDILQNCVEPHISRHASDSTCYNTYESRMELVSLVNRTVPRWTALFRQLHSESPSSRIYTAGYPSIASDTGTCPLSVSLGKSELEFAEELIHYLNGAIKQSAVAAGVNYVDISQALNGHRLCEASGNNVAVNGLTPGNDSGLFGIGLLGRESYHPNALGHTLIEQAILKQSNNFKSVSLSEVCANDNQTLLNAPSGGRTINVLVPDDNVINNHIHANTSSNITIDGARDGLQPNTAYSVHIDGAAGTTLATLNSDDLGNIAGPIILPSYVAAGGHTIDVTGPNQAGEPLDISEPVYVTEADEPAIANEDTTQTSPPTTVYTGDSAATSSQLDATPLKPAQTVATTLPQPKLSTDSALLNPQPSLNSPASTGLEHLVRKQLLKFVLPTFNLAFFGRIASWLLLFKHLLFRTHF